MMTLTPWLTQEMQKINTTAEFQAFVHANKTALPHWKILSMVTFYNSQGEIQ